MERLIEYFKKNNKVALAYSGGTDSALLMHAALKAGADISAYCVRSEFVPSFELEGAVNTAETIGAKGSVLKMIDIALLRDERIIRNSPDRCYYCKQAMMTELCRAAHADGFELVIDGNNADDSADDRPGMRASAELGIRSPLRELGITKSEVRRLSELAGLPTAHKPAYSCLATRIRTGEEISAAVLKATETAERYLYGLGYSDFRVRKQGEDALIQVTAGQMDKLNSELELIRKELGQYYRNINADTVPRKASL